MLTGTRRGANRGLPTKGSFSLIAPCRIVSRGVTIPHRADRRTPCRPGNSLAIVRLGDMIGNFTAQVAGVAQSAEHRFCKPTVVSSTLTASSVARSGGVDRRVAGTISAGRRAARWRDPRPGGYPSGQRGQTVNLVALPSQVRILLHPCRPARHGRSGRAGRLERLIRGISQRRTQSRTTVDPSLGLAAAGLPGVADSVGACQVGIRESRGCNSMVEYLPSKQATWVRFPSPALAAGIERSRRTAGPVISAARDRSRSDPRTRD